MQTVTVTGNWLDSLASFFESIAIYSVGEGENSDVMEYISIILSNDAIYSFLVQIIVIKNYSCYSLLFSNLKQKRTQQYY